MKTSNLGTREEPSTILCRILGMPVKQWFFIIALVLLFVALGVLVFADERGQQLGDCDVQSGLAATLNLSQSQCENMQQLTDRFHKDTAITRGKIMEKRIELKRLSEDTKAAPYAINNVGRKLNTLEQEFYSRAHQTAIDQKRFLTPEQINRMKDQPYGYGFHGYGGRGYGRQ
jgi:Spy/CpxP family protein refolding chaperone